MHVIHLPEKLVKKALKRGIDIEKEVLDYLIRSPNLDPEDEIDLHIELAEKYLDEGKKLIEKDPIQASEKLYKAAEEIVKALTIHFNLAEILTKTRSRGGWTVTDIDKAVKEISDRIGLWFLDSWDHAWILHVWGFHEGKMDKESIKVRLPRIEKMVKEGLKIIKSQ